MFDDNEFNRTMRAAEQTPSLRPPVFDTDDETRFYEAVASSATPRNRRRQTMPTAELNEDDLRALRHHRSENAWLQLSLANIDEALQYCEEENDIIAWAFCLAIDDDTESALAILESFIIATSMTLWEIFMDRFPAGADRTAAVRTRHSEIMRDWISEHTTREVEDVLEDEEFRLVVRAMTDVIDWAQARRYYIIALMFLRETGGTRYKAPKNMWFRYFFALFPSGSPSYDPHTGLPVLSPLTQEQTLALLLSDCEEWEVHYISSVCAYFTHRYRSCMTFATRFFACTGADRLAEYASVVYHDERVLMYVVRALSALEICERAQACADMMRLMSDDSSTVAMVGSSLAAYGLPLTKAADAVTTPHTTVQFQRYCFALCEYVHALTLLQIGDVENALHVARCAVPYAPVKAMQDKLHTLICMCATALEDSTAVLDAALSPYTLLYISLCPAFFGGLTDKDVKLRKDSDAYRLLYPDTVPLYGSIRQMLPFYMNRAHRRCNAGDLRLAWDDVCCAVACADEVVGSVEFAFSDCFPLHVYYFGCFVAFSLLNMLLQEEVSAVNACVERPHSKQLFKKLRRVNYNNDMMALEVIEMCEKWCQQMRAFFPHSVLGEIAQTQLAVYTREKQMLGRAILLSRRYPKNVVAQNSMTLALYHSHQVPEAVEAAQRNLQLFPHSPDVIRVHRQLQEKNVVYHYNYRTVVPLRYSPASKPHRFTKRFLFAILLLIANVLVLCLSAYFNLAPPLSIPGSMRETAVRMQLPNLIPLIFALLFLFHAIVAAVTPVSLIRTTLTDLFFTNTALTRFVYGLRGIALVNVVNAIQMSLAGNDFLFSSALSVCILYALLTLCCAPFTTRLWLLPSVDEPKVGPLSWLTLLSVDIVLAFPLFIPHALLAAVEPFVSIVYYFFPPRKRPTGSAVSSSVRRRLLYHEHFRFNMPGRFTVGVGSQFFYIGLLKLLYFRSHPDMHTKYLANSQIEEELYRAFPLCDPTMLGEVDRQPLLTPEELAVLLPPPTSFEYEPVVRGLTAEQREEAGEHEARFSTAHDNDETEFDGSMLFRAGMVNTVKMEVTRRARDRALARTTSFHAGPDDSDDGDHDSDARRNQSDDDVGAGFPTDLFFGNGPSGTINEDGRPNFNATQRRVGGREGEDAAETAMWGNVASVSLGSTSSSSVDELDEMRSPRQFLSPCHAPATTAGGAQPSPATLDGGSTADAASPEVPSSPRNRNAANVATRSYSIDLVHTLRNQLNLQAANAATTERAPRRGMRSQPSAAAAATVDNNPNRQAPLQGHPDANARSPSSPPGKGRKPSSTSSATASVLAEAVHRAWEHVCGSPAHWGAERVARLNAMLREVAQLTTALPPSATTDAAAQASSWCVELVLVLRSCASVHSHFVQMDTSNFVSALQAIFATPVLPSLVRLDPYAWCDTVAELVRMGDATLLKVYVAALVRAGVDAVHWKEMLQHAFVVDAPCVSLAESFFLIAETMKRCGALAEGGGAASAAYDYYTYGGSGTVDSDLQQAAEHVLMHDAGTATTRLSPSEIQQLLRRLSSPSYGISPGGSTTPSESDGHTFFTRLCSRGEVVLLGALVSGGYVTDLNQTLADGTNGLMQAVLCNQTAVVQWFCQQPEEWVISSFVQIDNNGRTVRELAENVGANDRILLLLEQAMCAG